MDIYKFLESLEGNEKDELLVYLMNDCRERVSFDDLINRNKISKDLKRTIKNTFNYDDDNKPLYFRYVDEITKERFMKFHMATEENWNELLELLRMNGFNLYACAKYLKHFND